MLRMMWIIIEEKQKELCPVGRYGRGYVYGSDREKYDAWDEIIDALENIPAADAVPVVHARWVSFLDGDHIMPERYYRCSRCGRVDDSRIAIAARRWTEEKNNGKVFQNCRD